MTDWTAGYVADIGYTYGYYPELNPLRVQMAFLEAGLVFPKVGAACELGFGQGVSVNAHAAASITQWHGTDFNPAQAGFAQELAQATGAGAKLYDEAFDIFCARSDLPDFDYICLHGIWSWVSDENRHVIVDFIRRKLKVGGVLYISYNVQCGWSSMIPARDLMTQHSEVMSAPGQNILGRIDSALDFMDQLMATSPAFARANPQLVDRFKQMKGLNRNYLAHEYFNRDWAPMPFSKMAEWLEAAKLTYACSAHPMDHVDIVNLTDQQQTLLKQVPDAVFRETVRDFCTNQNFRRDYWVKGARRLNTLEQGIAIREQTVVLVKEISSINLTIKAGQGEVTMQEAVYKPILNALSDYRPKSVSQIEQLVKDKNVSFAQLRQAMLILAGIGAICAVQDEAVVSKAKKQTDKLNAYFCDKAYFSDDLPYLVSPLIGACIASSRTERLFLLARLQGKKQAGDWAQLAWQALSMRGQKLVKENVTLETEAENMAELLIRANDFVANRLPILKALGIA